MFALGLICLPDAIAQSNGLESQRAALTHVGQAVSRVVVKAKKVNEKLGYGFTEGGSVFGVKLRLGRSAREDFWLKAGQSYVFIGSGDKTARNVDIILRDSGGRIVGQDIEADAAPFVLFQPKSSGRYTMSLNLKSGWSSSAFCAVTILRKGGIKLPLERLVEAAIRMDFASFEAFRAAKGGRFNENPGTWALYGAVVRPGQALSATPKTFAAVNRGSVAVGDQSVHDLDVALFDGNRKIITQDAKPSAAPKIIQKLAAGTYSLRVSNRSSLGPALVLAVLLDLPLNDSSAPQNSPTATASTPSSPQLSEAGLLARFEGDWKGDWADAKSGRAGKFTLRARQDGSVTGHFVNPPLGVSARFKGVIFSDGAVVLNYTQSKKDAVAEGTLRFTDEERQKLEGQVVFSRNAIPFGNAEFLLEKQH